MDRHVTFHLLQSTYDAQIHMAIIKPPSLIIQQDRVKFNRLEYANSLKASGQPTVGVVLFYISIYRGSS